MEEEKIYKILVVDDEDDLCEILNCNLETDVSNNMYSKLTRSDMY